jgi:hypothetical protein
MKVKTALWRITRVVTQVEERTLVEIEPLDAAEPAPKNLLTADALMNRCGRVAKAKGLPTTITPEEVRGAA